MPASKPSATMSLRLSSVVISSTMSGYWRISLPILEAMALVARRGTRRRTRPAGFPWSSDTACRLLPTSNKAGRNLASSFSPASVSATERVVRAMRRTPRVSSSARMEWLMAEGDTPCRFAALVKLFSSATATNVVSAAKSVVTIYELYSQPHARFIPLSSALAASSYLQRSMIGSIAWRCTMPHVIVKLWPGKSEQQKQTLANQITNSVMSILNYGEESVSVAIEEIAAKDWAAQVYRTDIVGHE